MPPSILHQSAVAGSIVASTLTGFRGSLVVHESVQPAKPITLYEFESCPHCRSVREALSALHLDVEIRPCPKGGTRFRREAAQRFGEGRFPLLVDENTNTVLRESAAINAYLFREYAGTSVPALYRPNPATVVFGGLASAARLVRGRRAHPSRAPATPLHLTSFEGSPFSRLVRERLCELEIPYTLHNLGKEHWREVGPAVRRLTPNPYIPIAGGKRDAFFREHGRVQVPFLEDPNTGKSMFESSRILRYLDATYAL